MTMQHEIEQPPVRVGPTTDVDRHDAKDLRRERSDILDRSPAYATAGVQTPTASYWPDRVRWGPIWAGLVTSLATFLLLSVAAVAAGALAVTAGADAEAAGLGGAIASAVIALVAFFVGGFMASRTATVMQRGYGAVNGFLVWALGLVLILALAAFGLGSLFGAAGDLFAQYQQLGSPSPQGVDPQQAAEGVRNSSLGAFVGMLLPAIAATLGGYIGARTLVRADDQGRFAS
ncbi:MAG TPA: hypothetical protein VK867_04055 [Candidatus Limnocylindrales bacterium]|nr:hypothetical protein [Candidatus Limnocylindrales bacterium]